MWKVTKFFFVPALAALVGVSSFGAEEMDLCPSGDCHQGVSLWHSDTSKSTSGEHGPAGGHCLLHSSGCCHFLALVAKTPWSPLAPLVEEMSFVDTYAFHFLPPPLDAPLQPPKI